MHTFLRFYPPTAYDTLTSPDFFMGHTQRRIYSWCTSGSEDSLANKLCKHCLGCKILTIPYLYLSSF